MTFDIARLALIRYTGSDGSSCTGSGLLINAQTVLTANHVGEGREHNVHCADGWHEVTHVLCTNDSDIDLALLTLDESVKGMTRIGFAHVDRTHANFVENCIAVGYPRWRKRGNRRISAEVRGEVPTAEGLEALDDGISPGFLTLVGNRMPARAPQIQRGSFIDSGEVNPWGGMSGAAVTAEGLVIGVVRSNNIAAGNQSLTVTSVAAIDFLPHDKRQQFWNTMGITSPESLPVLPRMVRAVREETYGGGYVYDVFVSYPPNGIVERWVHNRFLDRFKLALQEELGRQLVYAGQPNRTSGINLQLTLSKDLGRSRILLAILSRQYFSQASCLAELESMIQRQMDEGFGTEQNPNHLIHAVIAHDCTSDDSNFSLYCGRLRSTDFKNWVYDHALQGGKLIGYSDAIRRVAGEIAEIVDLVPTWRADFPVIMPTLPTYKPQQRPIL